MYSAHLPHKNKQGLRHRPGRLLLSETAIMGYFGLTPSVYAEEIGNLGGPNQKTILRIMRRQSKELRSNTKDRLKQANDQFFTVKLPIILGKTLPIEPDISRNDEIVRLAENFFELIKQTQESYVLETIEKNVPIGFHESVEKHKASRVVLYNLCIFNGFEHFLRYPHDMDMLVTLAPYRSKGKVFLPLRLWANQHISISKFIMSSLKAKNYSELATELEITKQTLFRYINARRLDHLPKFKTMVKWSELLKDPSGEEKIAPLSMPALFLARFLHYFYIDILERTSLSEEETLELFSMSEELRALWPSVFHASDACR